MTVRSAIAIAATFWMAGLAAAAFVRAVAVLMNFHFLLWRGAA